MKQILIKNGLLLSPVNGYDQSRKDILIENGRIKQIGDHLTSDGMVVDAEGCLVTPGLIDIHVHCFPHASLSLTPDMLGIQRGATTIVDAGSSGALTYEAFHHEYILNSRTKVFALLNVSSKGLAEKHELNDMKKIDETAIRQMIADYPDHIVGLKARASASVVGDLKTQPIQKAAQIAHKVGLPLMVHVGNYPPALGEVLDLLQHNDIVTHAFHGKDGGILNDESRIIPQAIEARKRGVKFDVGHGEASFSFQVYKQAMKEDFDCDFISSDLHVGNYQGPVYNLAAVLSKVINCGESLADAITKVTSAPAQLFKLKDLGELREGAIGDVSIMQLTTSTKKVVDAVNEELQLTQELMLQYTIYSRVGQSEVYKHDII